jgi:predicted transcriptional regulator
MSALSLRLPDSIHRHIKEFAQKEGISINQFIVTALAEKYPHWQQKIICRLGRNEWITGLLLRCWLRLRIVRLWQVMNCS